MAAASQFPDWARLQQALSIEAERGFPNLQGKQYRFSEFLCLNFGQAPTGISVDGKQRWLSLATEFARYADGGLSDRRQTVAAARQLLHDWQQGRLADVPSQHKQVSTLAANHASSKKVVASPQRPWQEDRGDCGTRPITLDTEIAKLPGITRPQLKALERLGLITARDLLFYYPREHLDYARQVPISKLVAGETVTIVGTVKRCNCFTSPRNPKLSIFQLTLRDRTGQIDVNRFFAGARFASRGWQEKQKRQYPKGATVAASGLVKKNKYGTTLETPELEVLAGPDTQAESLKIGRLLPVYPLTEGVSADMVRRGVQAALPAAELLQEPLPESLREPQELIGLSEAIASLHFPSDREALERARRRLVFDEFFFLQLGMLQRRQEQCRGQLAASFAPSGELLDRFQVILPFSLTGAQKRVVGEILQDLEAETPMNRLVQGDVGSGKTIVAVYAILAAVQAGYQAALMAPTEVLAEQHYRKLVNWFNLLHLPVELLTGSTRAAKRREIHRQLSTGELPLLVGTHALIEDPVQFQRLGLVAIDEQHRFGVQQRSRLLAKGDAPHVLTLTATPIPRTLALTLHGDLDVSQIDELPPGRQEIQTTILSGRERSQAYELIKREVAQGRQAYIVLPLVEESEKVEAKAATEEHARLQEKVFPDFKVGLLHGRMSSADKDAALTAFRDNESQIIVSTTVIEVGVDVPNATVMAIENAERFGLSQLHQLRGRVGRGQHKSYCLLVTSSKTPTALQRLGVLRDSRDGFFIAEMDMRLRGPGEVLGTRQSGLPDFALASLVEDQDVLLLAREVAEELISTDVELKDYPELRSELEIRHQRLLGSTSLT